MRFRGTLILLAVLVALGAYVLLVERQAEPTGDDIATATPQPPPLLTLAAADARVVRIESPIDGRRTECKYRDDDLWHLTAPQEGEADQGQVVRLVEELADLRPKRVLTETTAPLADFGLEPPAMRVEVELKDGSSHAVLLGARNADGSGFYALVEGQLTVYLIPSILGIDAERYLETPPAAKEPEPTAADTGPDTAD